jgi:hypothetical protein
LSQKNSGESILKFPDFKSGEGSWKYVYVLLCITLLCLTALQLYSFVLSDPHSGWDYRVFVGAVQAIDHGEDPYILTNIHQYTHEFVPYVYAPHALLVLWCLQFFSLFQNIWIYFTFLVVFLVASGYLIITLDQKPQYLFFTTLLLTGFISTFWNFFTGNKEILFLFLFAGIFHLLIKEKFWQSSVVLGILGSFTLVPLPFTALFLAIKRPVLQRIQYILLSFGVLAAIFLLTWLLNPELFTSFINTFFGSSSILNEPSGIGTPTPYMMLGIVLNLTNGGITIPLILVSLLYFCIIIVPSWYVIKKNWENPLKVYSLTMFAIFMVLPRIKPYYFIVLTIPLYFLFKGCSDTIKILVLAVISLLPLAVWYYFWIDHTQPISYLAFLIHEYSQTFSLFLIFVITIALEYYRPVSMPASPA